ncbi:MAG: response regulator [Bacteroidota bacterium]
MPARFLRLFVLLKSGKMAMYMGPDIQLAPYRFFASLLDRIKDRSPLSVASAEVIKESTQTKNIRVLLADDDSDDRELFEEVITGISTQIQLQSVEDGLQLMTTLHAENERLPDIIFLDLNMPGKSGKDCLREIKNNDRLKDVPVIIYSTSFNLKDINDTHAIGANLYIRKPNTFTGLIDVIKKVLSLNLEEYNPRPSRNNYFLSTDTI